MNIDIQSQDFWIEQWKRSLAQSVWSKKHGYTSRRIWNHMAEDYGKSHQHSRSRDNEPENLIKLLTERGLFDCHTRVLDIGCGAGRMTIPFALQGAEVVALDFSEKMLSRLHDSISPAIAGRIEIVNADWDEIDLDKQGWQGSFDLVFASMTPAIRTPDSFLKLHHASRSGCFFRGWAGKREDPLLEGLWQYLLKEPMPTMGWDITLAFNLLRAMGLSPAIEFQEVCWDREEPIERAADFFEGFFGELTDYAPDMLKDMVLEHLGQVAQNGSISRRTTGQTGTMTWSIK